MMNRNVAHWWYQSFIVAVVLFGIAGGLRAAPPTSDEEALSDEANQAVERLRGKLSADSEAILMLDDILKGSHLSFGSGWFRVALSQSRYDWLELSKRYDKDADGRISRDEFPGTDEQFKRLDRDSDKSLAESDLTWESEKIARAPGRMMFYQVDKDGNGKITKEEFEGFFTSLDSGGEGFLALDDLRDKFLPPSDGRREEVRPDQPSRSTLVLGLQRQEIGSLQAGPVLNEKAPDFTLKTIEGEEVTLSKQIGDKPIVLIMGNFTCGPFRSHAGNLEKLYHRYRDQATFLLVYVREAHPSDGWWMVSNKRVGIELGQPKTNEERCEVAGRCRTHLKLEIPFLVDTVDDVVGATYSGMPNRLYLIDREGKIAFKSGRGPFGFHPGELEQALIFHLLETAK